MDDKTPAQIEAEETETVDVEWEGITFTIPASLDELDLDALAAFEAGKSAIAIRAVLGETSYARMRREFQQSHGRAVKVKDMLGLLDKIAVTYGFKSAGE